MKVKYLICDSTLLALTVLLWLLAGCASVPADKDSLLQGVREAYTKASADENIKKNAAQSLQEAQEAIEKAESASSAEEIEHYAYVGKRKIQIAEQVATKNLAEQERRELSRQQGLDSSSGKARGLFTGKSLTDIGKQTPRGLAITLSNDTLFANERIELLPDALELIDKVAEFLKQNPTRNVLVEGHTDERGSDDYNQGLSERRANAVRFALVNRGIPSNRVIAKGYGRQQLIASSNSESGRQQNRRIEITLLNEGIAAP